MRFWKFLLPLLTTTLCFAQQDRIAGHIDSSQMVTLPGQIRRKAKPQYDQGSVEGSVKLNQVTLLTLPTPSQQQALRTLVAQQQDPKSPNYRKWLTPEQYAERFGLSQNDVSKISAWLNSQGLSVVSVARGRNWMVFSGTAAQVESAFRTQIHRYNINGEMHVAPATAPSIPAALAGIVTGFRGLDDFRPKPMYVRKAVPHAQGARPNYYDNNFSITDFLAPGDIATIYDLNALYSAGFDGTGQKLVIVGQTDVYLADLNAFRTGFGLPLITGCTTNSTTSQITACNSSNFVYVLDGADPGVASPAQGDLTEADLDLEWSAATARGAQIIFVNSTDVFTSYYYAIDNNLAPVISMSYGAPCEFDDNGLPADEVELTKANSLGITFMNSSGDSGSASCDPPQDASTDNLAVGGLAVSYPASSPEVTAVGGTAIAYPAGFSSTYWGTTDGTNGGTAQNPPLPETAWNDDVELTLTFGGTALSQQESYALVQSGGGASNCSVQTSDFSDCVSGFPQPSWQTVTVPGQTNNLRLVPDVSLLASPNFPGYVYCTPLEELSSDAPYDTETTSSCGTGTVADIAAAVNGIPVGDPTTVGPSLVGGTSASSPIFAGIVAILNQYLGASGGLGNINPTLYTLAKTTSNGAFHQITSGTNITYCQGATPVAPWPPTLQCPGASGTTGSFGYDASNADAATGYNLVTGLGSVDANKLAIAWAASESRSPTTTLISTPSSTVSQGTSVTFTATVTPSTATGNVSFYDNGSSTALGTATLSSGAATFPTTALPVGSNSVTATYNGDSGDGVSTSASPADVTVTAADFGFTAGALTPASIPAGQSASATLTISPVSGSGTVNFTPSSCTGLPAGATCSFTPPSVTFGGVGGSATTTLTISTLANMAPSGPQTITITGTVSGTGGTSHTATVSLTVTATNESFTLTTSSGASTFPVTVGGTQPVSIKVNGTNGFIVGSGAGATTALQLTYTCTGSPTLSTAEIACQISPGNGQPTNATAVTVTLITTAPTSQLRSPLRGSRFFYALLLPGLFGVVFVAGSRTRGLRLLSLIVVLGFSTLWLGSCGGGGGSNNTSPKNPGTPTGTYTITVTATTGGAVPVTNASAPLAFKLVVN
jgi:subtilase family serine protease